MKNPLLKKAILFSFCLLTSAFLLHAQAPQGIPYQAIARNASGAAIASTAVKVRFSIRDSIATGPIRYQEIHSPTTSALGLFSVNVGMGTVVSGTFSGINWGKNAKFLQVELDPAGGNSYTDLGTTQMMSVPYALSAATATSLKTRNSTYGQVSVYNCDGEIQFSPCLPKVSTNSPSQVTANSVNIGVNITSDGGGTITDRGVCWSINQNPTIADSKTTDGSGTGSFMSSLTGLISSTIYFARAYATNASGTAYGNQQTFTTNTMSGDVFNPNLGYGTVTDIDGNTYKTIVIGTQTWMAENLNTSKYRNGNSIPTNYSDNDWYYYAPGAYSAANDVTFGKLYNWEAVADSRGLCPVGWHVPSDGEWTVLENFLGGPGIAGGKLKSTSILWSQPNTGATNESGFSGLPGGIRNFSYSGGGVYSFWWSSTTYLPVPGGFYEYVSWYRYLNQNDGSSGRSSIRHKTGLSVRCLKD